jgi:hypothetical protein
MKVGRKADILFYAFTSLTRDESRVPLAATPSRLTFAQSSMTIVACVLGGHHRPSQATGMKKPAVERCALIQRQKNAGRAPKTRVCKFDEKRAPPKSKRKEDVAQRYPPIRSQHINSSAEAGSPVARSGTVPAEAPRNVNA